MSFERTYRRRYGDIPLSDPRAEAARRMGARIGWEKGKREGREWVARRKRQEQRRSSRKPLDFGNIGNLFFGSPKRTVKRRKKKASPKPKKKVTRRKKRKRRLRKYALV